MADISEKISEPAEEVTAAENRPSERSGITPAKDSAMIWCGMIPRLDIVYDPCEEFNVTVRCFARRDANAKDHAEKLARFYTDSKIGTEADITDLTECNEKDED